MRYATSIRQHTSMSYKCYSHNETPEGCRLQKDLYRLDKDGMTIARSLARPLSLSRSLKQDGKEDAESEHLEAQVMEEKEREEEQKEEEAKVAAQG